MTKEQFGNGYSAFETKVVASGGASAYINRGLQVRPLYKERGRRF